MNYDTLSRRPIHSGDVIDWEFLARQNLDQAFFDSISTDPFSGPQWGNLFRVNEPIYRELAREFFASFEFEASACRYDPKHNGVRFRLGGEPREVSLLELGRRVRLYTERRSRDNATLNGLSRAETVKANHLLMEFWPTIRDSGFNPTTRAVEEEEEAEEEAEGEVANEGAGGSAKMYWNMSQGNWQARQAQWMDQQGERWEQFYAWHGQQEAQAN
ncbi:hypothetical protein Tco_0902197 [Tanacetum coccineum]